MNSFLLKCSDCEYIIPMNAVTLIKLFNEPSAESKNDCAVKSFIIVAGGIFYYIFPEEVMNNQTVRRKLCGKEDLEFGVDCSVVYTANMTLELQKRLSEDNANTFDDWFFSNIRY